MSGAWDAMVADNAKQLRQDHGLIQQRREDEAWQTGRHHYGVSFKQGFRGGWWAGIEWLLNFQTRWSDLTEHETILELRKGSGSAFYPLFADDAHVILDCPNCGRVSVGIQGTCDQCTYEWN